MPTSYDIHLSAYAISKTTIRLVESKGISRDSFANNNLCDETAYHGTYRGSSVLPDNRLWEELTTILKADSAFVGSLEEEKFGETDVIHLAGKDSGRCFQIPQILTRRPEESAYKACDIHINVPLEGTQHTTLAIIAGMGLASFDKPKNGKTHRVYSITCGTLQEGRTLSSKLVEILGALPNLTCKVKFEETTRYVRLPGDAPVLPLAIPEQLKKWLVNVETL